MLKAVVGARERSECTPCEHPRPAPRNLIVGTMSTVDTVIVEVALNGSRDRTEHPAVPYFPAEILAEARRCADAGATVFHMHARAADGAWSADPRWYAEAHRLLRAAMPDALISITSLRPTEVPVAAVVDLLSLLAAHPATRPDLISINLGHIVAWERVAVDGSTRRTVHYPNDYEDIVALLASCRQHGIVPELGVMDLGFVSNAVSLRDDGVLPDPGWFLLELDSAGYGAGRQVAPASTANYDRLASDLRANFPGAIWAAHGSERPGYAVLRRALDDGTHVRVGFEDAVQLPDGRLAASNADLVAWVVAAAQERGREPATLDGARAIIGLEPMT